MHASKHSTSVTIQIVMLCYPPCLLKAKESWEMDLKEKLELSVEVKHKGNQYFKVDSPTFLILAVTNQRTNGSADASSARG